MIVNRLAHGVSIVLSIIPPPWFLGRRPGPHGPHNTHMGRRETCLAISQAEHAKQLNQNYQHSQHQQEITFTEFIYDYSRNFWFLYDKYSGSDFMKPDTVELVNVKK